MNIDNPALRISRKIADAALAGAREDKLLETFCTLLVLDGVPLARAVLGADTLHPVLEGRVFEWNASAPNVRQAEYGRSADAEENERWTHSPFYALAETNSGLLRRRLAGPDARLDFPVLEEVAARGMTDYVAMLTRFGESAAIGGLDSIYSSWATDRAEGFDDTHVAMLELLMPILASAVKGASLRRIAETIAETYLGFDAGRRVLRGTIGRGTAERIEAALWFSDLRGFTRLVDAEAPDRVIPLLNDYADAVVTAIHESGGQVLKFMGDGVLAIFVGADVAEGCERALGAARVALARSGEVSARRATEGLGTTEAYLGLHVGAVYYGNIGSADRLDFTVIGPAVNEVSRIAGMCKSLERPVVASQAFAASFHTPARALVSLGRYALRGIERPQELFTLDPDAT
jgi:adenylate cyclase